MKTHPYRAKIQRQIRRIAEVCKHYESVPQATPLMDQLDAAEERAAKFGRPGHRVWRLAYEQARSAGHCIKSAIAYADGTLSKLIGGI